MAYNYTYTHDVVGLFQQNTVGHGSFLDVLSGGGSLQALRLIQGVTLQRVEFRNNAGVFDIFYVDTAGVGQKLVSSTGHGQFRFHDLGVVGGPSVDLVVDTDGNVFKQNSSLRYKENVRPFDDDVAKVMALRPIAFTAKGGSAEQIGYAAEEVAEAGLEHLVTRDADGAPEAVSYKHLGIYAIELLKRQAETIARQGEEIDRLKSLVEGAGAPSRQEGVKP